MNVLVAFSLGLIFDQATCWEQGSVFVCLRVNGRSLKRTLVFFHPTVFTVAACIYCSMCHTHSGEKTQNVSQASLFIFYHHFAMLPLFQPLFFFFPGWRRNDRFSMSGEICSGTVTTLVILLHTNTAVRLNLFFPSNHRLVICRVPLSNDC